MRGPRLNAGGASAEGSGEMRLRSVFVIALSIVCMAGASVPGSVGAATRLTATAGHVLYAIRPEVTWPDPSLAATRSRVVILLPWQVGLMRQLKAANPGLIVLEYKDLGAASSYGPVEGFSTDGVSYGEAARAGWLLRDLSGAPIECAGFPYLWATDIGDAAFQRAWADEVVGELQSEGWDGVFIDNVNPTIRYYANVASVAKYPSDAAYSGAMGQALAYVTSRVHAAGKLAMANIGSWSSYAATASPWLRDLDGAMEERFTKFTPVTGEGYRTPGEWRTELSLLTETQREGKWFLGIAQSSDGDVDAERFGWATTLLGSDGHATFALQNDNEYGIETWFSDYEAPIGRALGAAQEESSGVWRRRFATGLVLVNPSTSTHTVSLGGRYSGDGLQGATRVTMVPHSGLILTGE